MRCPNGHENREGAAFCIECGAKLALVCRQCGRALPTEARFCDGCGLAQDVVPGGSQPRAAVPRETQPITEATLPGAAVPRGSRSGTADVPRDGLHGHANGAADGAPAPAPHVAAKILRERRGIEGERRTVTVLFVDAVGSTPAGEQMDAEEYHRIIHTATDKMIEAVNRFEGTVTQFRGDGVMAVFGAPIAREDSARRAVAAALAMREALAEYGRELNTSGKPAWSYRIGLNTGPVIVGSIGNDLTMDYTAIGDTVNLAARMEQSATAGSIYITEDTRRHVAPYFELEDVGPVEVKGRSGTVNVYAVLSERAPRTRLDVSAERGLTPYVGREELLESLIGHFASAKHGEGRVVFVQGEPGMGKSRLLLEFRRCLGDEAAWLEGRCISWGRTFPYLPIVDILRDTFGVEEGDDDARVNKAIDEHAERWDPAAAASAVPHLKYLLSMAPSDGEAAMDPTERRASVLDALRGLLMQESRSQPLVVVIEDLHWADEQSEEAIAALVDAVASSPVLLVLTYRPGYAHSLGDRTYYGRLVLRNLPPEESVAMVEGVLRAAGIPVRLQDMIVAKAEGNPFFIEEVSRSLVESGVLRRSGDRYMLVQPVEQVTIPDTIQEVILSRIDRLQRRAKEAVQYASVIGREFPVRLLKHIHQAEESMDALLSELKSLELIYEKSYFPELEYMFKHALTQEVALSTLLADRRKALHRTVAGAIEELYTDRLAEQHEALAYHYFEGEEWEKACEYAKQVAQRAASLNAPRATIEHATRAINAANNCDPDCNALLDAELYRLRGLAYEAVGEFDLAREDHEAATDLARSRDDRKAEWQASIDLGMLWAGRDYTLTGEHYSRAYELAREIGDEALVGRSLNRVGNWRVNIDHPLEGLQHHHEALAIFQRLEDKRGTAETLDFLAMTSALAGDMTNAIRYSMECIDLYRELDDKQGLTSILSGIGFYAHGFEALASAPAEHELSELEQYGEEAMRLAKQISSLPAQAFAQCQRTLELSSAGRYGDAFEAARTGLEIAESIGHTQWQTFAQYNLGCLYMDLGAHALSRKHFERSIELALQTGSQHWTRITNADFARGLAAEGDLARAAQILNEYARDDLPMISLGQRGLWLARAELYLASGDFAKALQLIDRLATTAKNAGAQGVRAVPYLAMLRGRALTAIGRLDAAAGDIEAAISGSRRLGLKTIEWRAIGAAKERAERAGSDAEAREYSRQALAIVEGIAASIPDAALRHVYLISKPVEALRAHAGAGSL